MRRTNQVAQARGAAAALVAIALVGWGGAPAFGDETVPPIDDAPAVIDLVAPEILGETSGTQDIAVEDSGSAVSVALEGSSEASSSDGPEGISFTVDYADEEVGIERNLTVLQGG